MVQDDFKFFKKTGYKFIDIQYIEWNSVNNMKIYLDYYNSKNNKQTNFQLHIRQV